MAIELPRIRFAGRTWWVDHRLLQIRTTDAPLEFVDFEDAHTLRSFLVLGSAVPVRQPDGTGPYSLVKKLPPLARGGVNLAAPLQLDRAAPPGRLVGFLG